MGAVLQLLFVLGLGYLLRRVLPDVRAERMSYWLNRYVLYIALTALVLLYIPGIEAGRSALIPVLGAWGLFALSALLVLLASKLAGWSRGVTGALLFTVPYGNTSFLGVPFTQAFFGEAGIAYSLIYDQLGSFLILSTIGIAQLAYYSSEEFSWRRVLKKILLFPSFLALIFSLLFLGLEWPEPLRTILSALAWSLAPAAMLSIGLQLRLRFASGELPPFLFAMATKLLLAPLILLGLFIWLEIEGLAAEVSVFEAGMAPMVSSSILAMMAGLERRFVASVLGYGILLSFLTLPGIYWLVERTL